MECGQGIADWVGAIVSDTPIYEPNIRHCLPGAFFSFEGGEGTGKTTQITLLETMLKKRGFDVVVTREPGGSLGAEIVRKLLLGGAAEKFGAEGEAILFSAARQDHIAQIIRPALIAGKIVLCDRFLDSTRAYQGVAGTISAGFLKGLETVAVGDCMPDLTFLLDIKADQGLERARARREDAAADRFEREDVALHEARRKAFLDIALADPDRFVVVPADRRIEAIAAEISLVTTTKLMERDIMPPSAH